MPSTGHWPSGTREQRASAGPRAGPLCPAPGPLCSARLSAQPGRYFSVPHSLTRQGLLIDPSVIRCQWPSLLQRDSSVAAHTSWILPSHGISKAPWDPLVPVTPGLQCEPWSSNLTTDLALSISSPKVLSHHIYSLKLFVFLECAPWGKGIGDSAPCHPQCKQHKACHKFKAQYIWKSFQNN